MANTTLEDRLAALVFVFSPHATQPGTENPELERLRQKTCEFEFSLNYVASPHLKKCN